jgi:hypothetical protein
MSESQEPWLIVAIIHIEYVYDDCYYVMLFSEFLF